MYRTLLRALRQRRSRGTSATPARTATFSLMYRPPREEAVPVGYLSFDGSAWTFTYDDKYKQRSDLRPIEGFDDVEKVYRSAHLFPFFAVRIPDVDRQDVRRRLREDHLDAPEETDLLRMFGRRVVSSPAFELLPVSA